MATDYDPIPGDTLIGAGTFDFTPSGGSEIKLRVKKIDMNFDRQFVDRKVPVNGILRIDRRVATEINDSFTLTIDEPRNENIIDIIFAGTIGSGTVPGSAPILSGSGTLKFKDIDGGGISLTTFDCQVEPTGSFSAEYGTFSEVQIKVTPTGSTESDLGTYDKDDASTT